jgi:hypothetical protein
MADNTGKNEPKAIASTDTGTKTPDAPAELGVDELESVSGGVLDASIVSESDNIGCGNINKCSGVGL